MPRGSFESWSSTPAVARLATSWKGVIWVVVKKSLSYDGVDPLSPLVYAFNDGDTAALRPISPLSVISSCLFSVAKALRSAVIIDVRWDAVLSCWDLALYSLAAFVVSVSWRQFNNWISWRLKKKEY